MLSILNSVTWSPFIQEDIYLAIFKRKPGPSVAYNNMLLVKSLKGQWVSKG